MSGLSSVSMPNSRVAFVRWLSRIGSGIWYWFWGKLLITGSLRLAFGAKIEGREHEPVSGPYIAAANHASALDGLLVGGAMRRQARFMAKEELFHIPVLNWWLASMGVFPVKRGLPDRKAIRRSMRILEEGDGLIMFPEGTRSPDGRLRDPEPGAAMVALRTGAPVLPVAVVNSHRILPKGARWPRFARVTIRIGPLIDVPKVEGRLDHAVLEQWGRRIMDAIAALLPEDQLPAQSPPGRQEAP